MASSSKSLFEGIDRKYLEVAHLTLAYPTEELIPFLQWLTQKFKNGSRPEIVAKYLHAYQFFRDSPGKFSEKNCQNYVRYLQAVIIKLTTELKDAESQSVCSSNSFEMLLYELTKLKHRRVKSESTKDLVEFEHDVVKFLSLLNEEKKEGEREVTTTTNTFPKATQEALQKQRTQIELTKFQIQLLSCLNTKLFSNYADRKIYKADDGALVMFGSVGIAAKTKEQRLEDKSLLIQTVNTIKEFMMHFLAQGKDPSEFQGIPLRFCVAVHNNKHWTAATITIKDWLPLYEKLFANVKNLSGVSETLHISQTETAIDAWLQKELQQKNINYKTLSTWYKTSGMNAHVDHYDSMNTKIYSEQVQESLKQLSENMETDFEVISCAYQRGYTCGEHAICNLIGAGLKKQLPDVDDDAIPSAALRKICDDILSDKISKENLQSFVNACFRQKVEIKPARKIPANDPSLNTMKCKSVENFSLLYMARIMQLSIIDPTPLFDEIYKGSFKGLMEELEKQKTVTEQVTGFFSIVSARFDELKNLAELLYAILNSNHPSEAKDLIYRDLGIEPSNSYVYCYNTALTFRVMQDKIERQWAKDHPQEFKTALDNQHK